MSLTGKAEGQDTSVTGTRDDVISRHSSGFPLKVGQYLITHFEGRNHSMFLLFSKDHLDVPVEDRGTRLPRAFQLCGRYMVQVD